MSIGGKIALFLGGTLFGSAGLKILSGKDARKAYTHTTAAVLRCKDEVMKQVELFRRAVPTFLPTRSRSMRTVKRLRKQSTSKKVLRHEIPDHA